MKNSINEYEEYNLDCIIANIVENYRNREVVKAQREDKDNLTKLIESAHYFTRWCTKNEGSQDTFEVLTKQELYARMRIMCDLCELHGTELTSCHIIDKYSDYVVLGLYFHFKHLGKFNSSSIVYEAIIDRNLHQKSATTNLDSLANEVGRFIYTPRDFCVIQN